MDRAAKLRQLAAVLLMAADRAREIAKGSNGISRENALATQIKGIAMEFELLAKNETDDTSAV